MTKNLADNDLHYKKASKSMRTTCFGKLNEKYSSAGDIKNILEKSFKNKIEEKLESGVQVISSPFTCCILPHFIDGERFLEELQDELCSLDFHDKNNDLYKFKQSDDLQGIKTPHIKALRKILYDDFRPVLGKITGIPLNNTIDMTCSQYNYTDVLLCHDDELEGRCIAFILYLVPKWDKKDGGLLNLFGKDENGQPDRVEKSFCPTRNTFIFFEVSPISFHEVSEVLTKDKTRLSISGWFHGPPFDRPKPYVEPITDFVKPQFIEEEILRSWINPIYLEDDVQISIQERFQEMSEIQLQDFFKEDKFMEVSKALRSNSIEWLVKGPANKRNYDVAKESMFPSILKQCLDVFHSEAMFLILSNLTGLTLHELAAKNKGEDESSEEEEAETPETSKNKSRTLNDESTSESKSKSQDLGSDQTMPKEKSNGDQTCDSNGGRSKGNPKCRSYVRQWRHGSYTLLHDEDQELSEFALDATLAFCSKDWKTGFGGYTSYIAKGEDEELLTVEPYPNSLALVYRDKETLRFTKYINNSIEELPTREQSYQDVHVIYYE